MKNSIVASTLAAALVAVASFSAFAADAPVSRAEVKAEAKVANKDGSIDKMGNEAGVLPKTKSTKTRAEVKAEAKVANKDGSIESAGNEAGVLPKTKGTAARAKVKAEARDANKKPAAVVNPG